ncbi:DUF1775 domain-containing protein [Kitasatospora sp. NPDC088346]|uniref:DUF1775 domain-containing protein n=1 Tax=Kitasatospora sp. NPDC088346 TaxID=3364073 RepID=UPI0038016392
MKRSRPLARAAVLAAALVGLSALAGPASAHVEVTSSTPQALAVDAVVAFDAEGESSSAGIKEVRVVLPAGLAPADVSLAGGPEGWTLTPAEDGYTVAGPALAPGEDAEYRVKVRQLPAAAELAFKSVVTYTDGQVDRWIELPQAGAEPAHPAPVLKLTAAAPGAAPLAATPPPSPSPVPTPSPAATEPATPAAAPVPASPSPVAAAGSGGSAAGRAALIGVVAVLALGAGVAVWRRSSRG